MKKSLLLFVFTLLLVSCGATNPVEISIQENNLPNVSIEDAPEEEAPPAEVEADAVTPSVEVPYFTPSQGEGPYYTVEKPDDRDNDLTVLAGASGQPQGEVIEFFGTMYHASGLPISGAVIEIWQTDSNGVYLHPGDPGTETRDRNFQFYGEATTADDGTYRFRTILPGRYEPRPMHIHFKVLVGGQVVLTSQFYFLGDPSLETDGLVAGAGSESKHLIITLYEGEDANGNAILIGERDIFLDLK